MKAYNKNIFAKNLTQIMSVRDIKQADIVSLLGVSKSTVSSWCNGDKIPRMDRVQKLADYFGISMSDLIEEKPAPVSPHPSLRIIAKGKYVPLYGRIACGSPILAVEDLEETVWVPDDINVDFALTCVGDSMINARIFDGDTVYIHQQSTVENGEIAAVIVNDEEVTLKRVYYHSDANELILRAENPNYPSQIYQGEALNHVRILGKAVYFLSTVR